MLQLHAVPGLGQGSCDTLRAPFQMRGQGQEALRWWPRLQSAEMCSRSRNCYPASPRNPGFRRTGRRDLAAAKQKTSFTSEARSRAQLRPEQRHYSQSFAQHTLGVLDKRKTCPRRPTALSSKTAFAHPASLRLVNCPCWHGSSVVVNRHEDGEGEPRLTGPDPSVDTCSQVETALSTA